MFTKQNSKAIAIILFVVLYLLFLTTAFTNERDTYICYTTKTGKCYHSAFCDYIGKSAYETTVYEACRNYRPCSYCNPCVDRFKTTIKDRNYIAPFFISGAISIAIFYFLNKEDTLKEEETNNSCDGVDKTDIDKDNADTKYSLSMEGETPTKYGDFTISGDDVRLDNDQTKNT